MAVTITRTKTDMIGAPASVQAIAGGASYTSGVNGGADLDLASPAGVVEADVVVAVLISSSPPGSAPTLQFWVSLDGTNFVQDGGTITVGLTASTTFSYTYRVPDSAKKARVTIQNGTTFGITAWVQGSSLAVS